MTSITATEKPVAIIFLDIDGVLYSRNRPAHDAVKKKAHELFKNDWTQLQWLSVHTHFFSKEAVGHLHDLIARVEKVKPTQIVLSSGWREDYSTDELKQMFAAHPFHKKIISRTERLSSRGAEIDEWLIDNLELNYENYVILDDFDDRISDLFPNNFVQVDHLLTKEHVNSAYKILTKPKKKS